MLTGAAAGEAVATALSQPAGQGALAIYTRDYAKIVAPFPRAKFWRRLLYPRLLQRLFAAAFRYEPIRKRLLVGGSGRNIKLRQA